MSVETGPVVSPFAGVGQPRAVALAGRVVLVTGGGSGLGAATGSLLAETGMHVVVADLDGGRAVATADTIAAAGGSAIGERLDVRDGEAAAAVVARAIDRFGRLDVVVNSAGTDITKSFEAMTAAEFDTVLDVNLRGPANVTRAALPALRRSDAPAVVNVVSTAAKRTWPDAAAYHASKWGLLGWSHAMHAELRVDGIRVTAIVAGGMRTPFILDRFPDTDPAVLQDPATVAATIRWVLALPAESVIPEVMVLPMRETSWP
jgi:NAD(P)-dependent dehydrogenase (short-subunit alcohol dehydrogenase family)